MLGLLKQAHSSLENLVKSKIAIERKLANHLLYKAQGIVFITTIKAQFGLGAEVGSGVVMKYEESSKGWSGPCAVGLGGLTLGFQIAASQIDHIIVLHEKEAVESFTTSNQLKLSGSVSAVIAKGSEAAAHLTLSDNLDTAAIVTYSQASGISLGVSMNGQVIKCRDDCNKDFYGNSVTPKEIFDCKVKVPKNDDYSAVCQLLDEYTTKDPNETEKEKEKE